MKRHLLIEPVLWCVLTLLSQWLDDVEIANDNEEQNRHDNAQYDNRGPW